MNNENTYLYLRSNYNKEVYRYKILRETEKNVWIEYGHTEKMISKKYYSIGKGFETLYFYMETPELLGRYKETIIRKKFLSEVEELKNITNTNTMETILNFLKSLNNNS